MKHMARSGMALAAAAAILVANGVVAGTPAFAGKKVQCFGVNACKGKSACKTANSACKGHNACKGKGVLSLSKSACLKKGGKIG